MIVLHGVLFVLVTSRTNFPSSSLLWTVGTLCIFGCNADSPRSVPARQSSFVTVVGDETASAVIDELAKHDIRSVETLERQADSSVIVVVQDSTVGPLSIHSDLAKGLEKRPAEEYVWVFTNTSMVGDQELLELEELECREIFNSQGLPGDDIMFGFDSSTALVSPTYDCPKGWTAIVRYIRNVAR